MKFWRSALWTQAEDLLDIARVAEEVGFYGVNTSDHLVFLEKPLESRYPYSSDGKAWWNPSTHWADTWVSIGAMAAITDKLAFTNAVYILPLRDLFTVAKAVGTAAVMSDNRVTLGVGIGWQEEEFDLVGEDFHQRGDRCDEMIEVLRLLWKGGSVEFHGDFYDFGPLAMSPAPTEPVPIHISGYSKPALRRTARFGDGWIVGPVDPDAPYSYQDVPGLLHTIQDLRREAGRENLPFEVMAPGQVSFDVDHYRMMEDMGITAVSVIHGDPTAPVSMPSQRQFMEEFADKVISRMY
tara:strand:+ start:187 stop:1071 length:885 start_codon:yes stop_codon:yes gene_type:complete